MALRRLLLFSLVFWLAGCEESYYTTFANHTSGTIVLVTQSSRYDEKRLTIPAGHSVIFDGGLTAAFSVESEARHWKYSFPYRTIIPSTYRGRIRDRLAFYFQLEPDGRIYLQMPLTTLPVDSLPGQIKGFPINPQVEQ